MTGLFFPMFVLVVVNLFWAGSYTVAKFGLHSMNPLVLVYLRISISAIILVLFVVIRRDSWRIGYRDFALIALAGILTGACQWLVVTGIEMSRATDASLLYVFEPIWGIILAGIILRERISLTTVIAFLIVVVGLVRLSDLDLSTLKWTAGAGIGIGNILIVIGLLCESLFTIVLKPVARRRPPALVMAIALAFATTMLSVPMAGHMNELGRLRFSDILVIGYLAVICTALGYSAWVWVMRRVPVNVMYFTLFIQPITGPFIACVALGEKIDARIIVGGAFLIFGMIVAVFGYAISNRREVAISM